MDSIDASSNARHRYAAGAPGKNHAASPAAQDEFTQLDRAESFRLLAGVPVGRLIFTSSALPAVRPVNFALVDGLIVLRTAAATVARKVHDTIVAFEADHLDPATCSGWSVTVTGRAALVTDPSTIARYQTVPLVPRVSGARDQFVTITAELVEGLCIRESADGSHSAGGRRLLSPNPLRGRVASLDTTAAARGWQLSGARGGTGHDDQRRPRFAGPLAGH